MFVGVEVRSYLSTMDKDSKASWRKRLELSSVVPRFCRDAEATGSVPSPTGILGIGKHFGMRY